MVRFELQNSWFGPGGRLYRRGTHEVELDPKLLPPSAKILATSQPEPEEDDDKTPPVKPVKL